MISASQRHMIELADADAAFAFVNMYSRMIPLHMERLNKALQTERDVETLFRRSAEDAKQIESMLKAARFSLHPVARGSKEVPSPDVRAGIGTAIRRELNRTATITINTTPFPELLTAIVRDASPAALKYSKWPPSDPDAAAEHLIRWLLDAGVRVTVDPDSDSLRQMFTVR